MRRTADPGVPDGLLLIDKASGPTSHDIVGLARRGLGTPKVGHTGTLDPLASGVLPLVVGRATRLAQFLSVDEKVYLATIGFGRTTDTYDAAGTVTGETGRLPDVEALTAALATFVGTFEQRPPAHSAKKVDGVRAYTLARQQVAVALRPATVTAHQLDLVAFDGRSARVRVRCSAGFYVRSLAHDLGERLGTGAVLDGLVRTRVGGLAIEDALPSDELRRLPRTEVWSRVRPMAEMLPELPAVSLTSEAVARVRRGQDIAAAVSPTADRAGRVRLLDTDGRLLALAAPSARGGEFLHPFLVVG